MTYDLYYGNGIYVLIYKYKYRQQTDIGTSCFSVFVTAINGACKKKIYISS